MSAPDEITRRAAQADDLIDWLKREGDAAPEETTRAACEEAIIALMLAIQLLRLTDPRSRGTSPPRSG